MLKKYAFAMTFLFCLSSGTAFAQNQPTQGAPETQSVSGVSNEDVKKLKEAAQLIGNAFGVTTKQESKKEAAPQPKTLADVADKGLDMVKNFVATLSDTLQKIAPRVWEVMVRQQYAKAISGLIVPWGLIVLLIIFVVKIKKWWDKTQINDEDEMTAYLWLTRIIPFIAGFVCAIWGCIRFSDSVTFLINPEYYAIKDLLEMILR